MSVAGFPMPEIIAQSPRARQETPHVKTCPALPVAQERCPLHPNVYARTSII